MAEFDGFTALITGASRGIGFEIARNLIEKGAKVILCGKNETRLKEAQKKLNAFEALAFDVTNYGEMQVALSNCPPIHFLINNAGNAFSAPFLKTSKPDLDTMLSLNLSAPFLLCQLILPKMLIEAKNKPCRIINIASTAGLIGYPYVSAYVAAKHGLVGLTKALAIEFAGKNITVNAIAPGFTQTDLVKNALTQIQAKTGRSFEEAAQTLASVNPQGRFVTPQEVASAVSFLCSKNSGMMNGHILTLDGGEVIK